MKKVLFIMVLVVFVFSAFAYVGAEGNESKFGTCKGGCSSEDKKCDRYADSNSNNKCDLGEPAENDKSKFGTCKGGCSSEDKKCDRYADSNSNNKCDLGEPAENDTSKFGTCKGGCTSEESKCDRYVDSNSNKKCDLGEIAEGSKDLKSASDKSPTKTKKPLPKTGKNNAMTSPTFIILGVVILLCGLGTLIYIKNRKNAQKNN